MKAWSLFLVLAVTAIPASADILGTTLPQIQLTDGAVLQQVRLLRASAEANTVTISVDRSMQTLPLSKLPEELRRQILAECSRPSYQRERNVVPAPAVTIRSTNASAPPTTSSRGGEELYGLAAKQAPGELLMHLQKTFQRVSSLDCIIRSNEKIAGWQRIRVGGTASFSMWDHYRRDYVQRVAKFEVEFEIVDGDKIKANTVTFDGLTGRVES